MAQRNRANAVLMFFLQDPLHVNTMKTRTSCILGLLLISPLATGAEDVVYPPAFSISSHYSLPDEAVPVSGTFAISRTLINNEFFSLSGLFFSDHLPEEFVVLDQSLTINGIPCPFFSIGPITEHMETDLHSYYWIVDSMGVHDGIEYQIMPHDTVLLELQIVCNTPGDYVLPLHTAVFSGNGTGFFATSQPFELTVSPYANAPEPGHVSSLPAPLVTSAYPNPFNPVVIIDYSGQRLAGSEVFLSIFDLSGKMIQRLSMRAHDDSGSFTWRPDSSIGSGVFLYKVSSLSRTAEGKLILLK